MNNLGVVQAQHRARRPGAVDELSRVRRRDRPRGDGPGRPDAALHPAGLPGAQLCGTGRHRAACSPATTGCSTSRPSRCEPGDVVVAACTTESEDGFFGELLATSFRARGAQGLVIDGGVRDVKDLRRWSSRCSAGDQRQGHGQGHARLGQHPGGLRRRAGQPGDVVVADVDGVVVVPARSAAAGGRGLRGSARPTRRASARKFRAGVLGLDMYNMREPLADAGLRVRGLTDDDRRSMRRSRRPRAGWTGTPGPAARSSGCPRAPSTPTATCSGPATSSLRARAQVHALRRAARTQLFALRDHLGFARNVIVQATCHGADNSALVDALRRADGRRAGSRRSRRDVTDAELARPARGRRPRGALQLRQAAGRLHARREELADDRRARSRRSAGTS